MTLQSWCLRLLQQILSISNFQAEIRLLHLHGVWHHRSLELVWSTESLMPRRKFRQLWHFMLAQNTTNITSNADVYFELLTLCKHFYSGKCSSYYLSFRIFQCHLLLNPGLANNFKSQAVFKLENFGLDCRKAPNRESKNPGRNQEFWSWGTLSLLSLALSDLKLCWNTS